MSIYYFDNADRNRYYGLRIGDIVNVRGISGSIIYLNVEVYGYGGDNNRVVIKLPSGNTMDWVAEWCEIVTKVEDKTKSLEKNQKIIEKLARELSLGIDNTGNIEELHNFGALGLRTCRELVTIFYNDIKKELEK